MFDLMSNDFIFEIYKDKKSVFSIQEIAMLVGEPDFERLKQRVNYYVKTHKLRNIRRGVYVKDNYSPEELACKIFTPAYISLEYVLQKSGMIFQYSGSITVVSYLNRIINVDGRELKYRKIKNDILYNTAGVIMDNYGIACASPERAFMDIIYLNREFHLDNIHNLNREAIRSLLPVYNSEKLGMRVNNLLKNA